MATIADIEKAVLDLLEESRSNPQFWSLQDEVRPFIVEALNEATLITGEPQVRSAVPVSIVLNSTLQPMPNGALALVRLEGVTGSISKTTMWDLDQMVPGWENATGTAIKNWFPIGLTQWGVYPKITAAIKVVPTVIALPVPAVLPYTGAETVPFQQEFFDGFSSYAAHVARLKEGGIDFSQSMVLYDEFLKFCSGITSFADRKGTLRFTKYQGLPGRVTQTVDR